MKICFLTHNLREDNGAGVFSSHLIRGLSGFETVTFTHEELLPLWRFLAKLKMIKNCDLIHALDAFPYGVLAVGAGRLLGKKVIITAVGTGAVNRLYHPFYSIFLKWAYRRASQVVAVSNFTKQEILKKVPGLGVKVINHGVDYEKFNILTSDVDRTSDVQKFKPYILSVGALRWRKGYKFSVRSFSKLIKLFPDLNYVIIGKKYSELHLSSLKAFIRELHLEERVFILENVSRELLLQFYKGAELFCLLSQNISHDVEGFGLVFLEAAAAGLPVVGSRDSGVEDALRDGENGFLVSERDLEGFQEAIIKILSDQNLKKRMSQNSLAFAKAMSWDEKIKEYVKLYKLYG